MFMIPKDQENQTAEKNISSHRHEASWCIASVNNRYQELLML